MAAPILDTSYPRVFAESDLRVTRGSLSLDELAEIWEVPKKAAMVAMSLLRNHGFEVRNWMTNPQIAHQHVLIPYPFPTLNRQSVQFHKSLQW